MQSTNSVPELDRFTHAYVEAALWSSTDDDGTPLDEDSRSWRDVDPATLQRMAEDCRDFQAAQATDLDAFYGVYGWDLEQAGHDFWLTRNRHGAGFWDRGAEDVGQRLSVASKAYGEIDLYVGDDGKVHGA